jgi:hypothetical protein
MRQFGARLGAADDSAGEIVSESGEAHEDKSCARAARRIRPADADIQVELRGLEPLTSSMPWKRATNCAKAP